jgi:peroxiredoxin
MKKMTSLLFITLLFVSCTNINAYNIKGELDDSSWDGKQIALYGLSGEAGLRGIDSTVIEHKTFKLKGDVDTVGWYVLMVRKDDGRPLYKDFYVEGDLKCTIKDDRISITGSPVNDAYQSFEDQYNTMTAKLIKINTQWKADPQNEELKTLFNAEYSVFVKSFRELAKKTVTENMGKPLAAHVFQAALSSLENADIEEVMKQASPDFLADPTVQMVVAQMKMSKKVNVGNKCPDLAMFAPDGSPVSLYQFVGKGTYVLIDFWASWCAPCMRELPNVLACYSTYHAKGFNVVGVSLDEDSEAWKAAIKKNHIPWPQMSDLAGWKSQAVAVYSFSGIPHTVLVDPHGIILAKDLRGDALKEKLAEVLGE